MRETADTAHAGRAIFNPPEIRRSLRRYCSFGEGPTAELRESSVLLPKIMSFLLSEREGSGRKTDRLFKYCEQRNNRSAPDESHPRE